jgi:hypothetical protein
MTEPNEVERTLDALLASVGDAERRLEAAGETRAHDWAFALREVLLDYRRILPMIATLPELADRTELTARVRDILVALRYEAGPHATGHLDEALASMDDPDR